MPVILNDHISNDLSLSQTDLNSGYELRDYDDGAKVSRYITSDSVNRHIRVDKIGLAVLAESYEVPEKLAKYSKIMLEHQLGSVEDGQFEDHRICGLFSNVTPQSGTATIGFAKYYDTLATFKSFPYVYKEGDYVQFSGTSFVYNDFGVVYPLSLKRSANPIGASTIAITADRSVLVQRQPDSDAFKPGALMPSGSGVTSYHDYNETGVKTLQELVAHCAEYKLINECNISKDHVLDTLVMGMARVPVGMKPDFFCYTVLDATWEELKAEGAEAYQVLETRPHHLISETLRNYIAAENEKRPGSVSVQLYLATEFLAEICR